MKTHVQRTARQRLPLTCVLPNRALVCPHVCRRRLCRTPTHTIHIAARRKSFSTLRCVARGSWTAPRLARDNAKDCVGSTEQSTTSRCTQDGRLIALPCLASGPYEVALGVRAARQSLRSIRRMLHTAALFPAGVARVRLPDVDQMAKLSARRGPPLGRTPCRRSSGDCHSGPWQAWHASSQAYHTVRARESVKLRPGSPHGLEHRVRSQKGGRGAFEREPSSSADLPTRIKVERNREVLRLDQPKTAAAPDFVHRRSFKGHSGTQAARLAVCGSGRSYDALRRPDGGVAGKSGREATRTDSAVHQLS